MKVFAVLCLLFAACAAQSFFDKLGGFDATDPQLNPFPLADGAEGFYSLVFDEFVLVNQEQISISCIQSPCGSVQTVFSNADSASANNPRAQIIGGERDLILTAHCPESAAGGQPTSFGINSFIFDDKWFVNTGAGDLDCVGVATLQYDGEGENTPTLNEQGLGGVNLYSYGYGIALNQGQFDLTEPLAVIVTVYGAGKSASAAYQVRQDLNPDVTEDGLVTVTWEEFVPFDREIFENVGAITLEATVRQSYDFNVLFYGLSSHFIVGHAYTDCDLDGVFDNNEQCSRPPCTVQLSGSTYTGVSYSSNFNLGRADFYGDLTGTETLPWSAHDFLALRAASERGFWWFHTPPGRYSVSVTCRNDVVSSFQNVNFCITNFWVNSVVREQGLDFNCGNSRWMNITCYPWICDNNDVPHPLSLPSTHYGDPNSDIFNDCSIDIPINPAGPSITCPPDVSGLGCNQPFPDDEPTSNDPCGGSTTLTHRDNIQAGECGDINIRTWVARTASGLTASCQVTYERTDLEDPTWATVHPDVELNCDACITPQCTGLFVAEDDCGGVEVTHNDNILEDSACVKIIQRVWRATDSCAHTIVRRQTIALTDTTPPVISPIADCTSPCGSDVPSVEICGVPQVTDDCSTPDLRYANLPGDDRCDENCGGSARRRWRARDDCGNRAFYVQDIVFVDESAPQIQVPLDVEVPCGASKLPRFTGSAIACDNCDQFPWLGFVDSVDRTCNPESCLPTEVITRTWTTKDNCGLEAAGSQTIVTRDCPNCDKVRDECVRVCYKERKRFCNFCSRNADDLDQVVTGRCDSQCGIDIPADCWVKCTPDRFL